MTTALSIMALFTWAALVAAVTIRRARTARVLLVPPAILMASGLVTYLASGYLSAGEVGPGQVIWIGANNANGALIFATAGFALTLGVFFASHIVPQQEHLSAVPGKMPDIPSAPMVVGLAIVTPLIVAIYGIPNLVQRDIYATTFSLPSLASWAGILTMSGVSVASLLTVTGKGGVRYIGATALCILTIVLFATGSRFLGIVPLIILLMYGLSRGRISGGKVALAGVASLFGLAVALDSRSATFGEHGLVPYASRLATLSSLQDWGVFREILANFLFAVPLAEYVQREGVGTFNDLAIAMSIMPGSSEEWDTRSQYLRVHYFIPYNAIGELAHLSMWLLAFVLFSLGFLSTLIVLNLQRRGWRTSSAIIVGLYVLSIVLMLQYNLRSSMRVIYAAMFAGTILLLMSNHRRASRRWEESSAAA